MLQGESIKLNDKVSVIIPVYNIEKILPQCLKSVINQSHKNLEIILVDDGSTDSSGKICDEYQKKDNRIMVIHKKNEGVSNARNDALDIATGVYIYFIDSDDYIESTCIEKLVKKIVEENADLVMSDFNYVDEKSKELEDTKKFYVRKNSESITGKIALYNINWYLWYNVWGKLYKKELFQTVRFPKDKRISEDHYVLTRVTALANKIAFVNEVLYHYVQQESSITHNAPPHFDTSEALFDRVTIMYKNGIHWDAIYREILISVLHLYNAYKQMQKTEENKKRYKEILSYYKQKISEMNLNDLKPRRKLVLKLCTSTPLICNTFLKLFYRYERFKNMLGQTRDKIKAYVKN